MRYLAITIIVFICFSCKKENKAYFSAEDLFGNWSSIEKKSYQEFYFKKDNMYTYSPYSGNILQYRFIVKNDSIYRYFIHPELINQEYEFYDKIIKVDSVQINLERRTLVVMNDSNTLGMFINKEIDYKIYDKSISYREKNAISLKTN